jgi:thioredoxin-like negative regulator of GroEL
MRAPRVGGMLCVRPRNGAGQEWSVSMPRQPREPQSDQRQVEPADASARLARVTDASFAQFSATQRAVLVLTRADCERCRRYIAELEALLERGQLAGVVVGALELDHPDVAHFQRDNRWLFGLEALPFTLLYQAGAVIDTFGALHAEYLVERSTNSFARRRVLVAAQQPLAGG